MNTRGRLKAANKCSKSSTGNCMTQITRQIAIGKKP